MSILCVSIFGIRFVYEYFVFGFSALVPRVANCFGHSSECSLGLGGIGAGLGGKWLRGKGGFMEKECDQRFENSNLRNCYMLCKRLIVRSSPVWVICQLLFPIRRCHIFLGDIGFNLFAVGVIIGQRRVHLSECQMRILEGNFLRCHARLVPAEDSPHRQSGAGDLWSAAAD
jgi:hypothetical protein